MVDAVAYHHGRSERKLLVVERRLVANHGHNHTQIEAIRSIIPGFALHIVAGHDYDGFLGEAAGIIRKRGFRHSRLSARLRYGTMPQRVSAAIGLLKAGRVTPCRSAYGETLLEACRRHGFGPRDAVVVPAANLESLESALELSLAMGADAPSVCLRFLGTKLTSKDPAVDAKRLAAIVARLPASLHLLTETEEAARFLSDTLGVAFKGGFFMPCSMYYNEGTSRIPAGDGVFRVGLFGGPRPDKGSPRIVSIVREVAQLAPPGGRIEFVVQGSERDFDDTGVYGGLTSFLDQARDVRVSPRPLHMPGTEFKAMFDSVNAVLLPYDGEIYRLRGSGLVQDAISSLKLVVHTRGIAMAELLSHGNAASAVTDRDFTLALVEMAADPARHRDDLLAAARYYNRKLASSPLRAILLD